MDLAFSRNNVRNITGYKIAINGQLGKVLISSSQAAFVSFFVGTITLIIVVGIMDRSSINIKEPIKQSVP